MNTLTCVHAAERVQRVLLQNDAAKQIETDPVPNLIIPLWAIIAYVVLIFKAQRTASSEKAGND